MHSEGLFGQITALSPEELVFWRQHCQLASPVDTLWADPARSLVVLSPPGAGLTTALALLPHHDLLTFSYGPSAWPGGADAFSHEPTHFGQWMGQVALLFTNHLREDTARVGELSNNNLELLLWLTQRYRGERQRDLLLHRLTASLGSERQAALTAAVQRPHFQQLYGDTGSERAALLEECVDIARALGWKGVFAAIDIGWSDWAQRTAEARRLLTTGVRELLGTLSPLQVAGFGYKMGLTTLVGLTEGEIRGLVRGRANVVRWSWSEARLRELVRRYLAGAGNDTAPWADLFEGERWQTLVQDVQAIWGEPGPAAAVRLAHQLHQLGPPRDAREFRALRHSLYAESARLWLDPTLEVRTVWRGPRPIVLDDMPFRFMKRLWAERERGAPVNNEALRELAGTNDNLDKNITRLRERLEPFYRESREYVYIQRAPNQGVQLTAYVKI